MKRFKSYGYNSYRNDDPNKSTVKQLNIYINYTTESAMKNNSIHMLNDSIFNNITESAMKRFKTVTIR